MISPELRKHIWDKQWLNSVKKQKGLAILPNMNLVSNIGSGDDATHTTESSEYTAMKAGEMHFPLVHPAKIKPNIRADYYTYRHIFGGKLHHLLYQKIKPILPAPLKPPARYVRKTLKSIRKSLQLRKEHENYQKLYKKYREFTMIPEPTFCDNLDIAMKFEKVKGAVVECGVWRGGMTAAMAQILGNEREYFLYDSFEGLPEAKEIDGHTAISWQKNTDSKIYYNNCTAEIKFAEQAMKLSGAGKYHMVKGWFNKTLPEFGPQPIAILRLDGDWYDSTMECLDNLYKHVALGGVIIVDDYYTWDGCAKAIHDYLSKNKLADRIYRSDKGVCYIIKS
jgi:O-methyltransferase